MPFQIDRLPPQLVAACGETPERAAWLTQLPRTIRGLQQRWSIAIDTPIGFEDASCSWVASVTLVGGTSAVLKLGMPHMEGEHEITSAYACGCSPGPQPNRAVTTGTSG